MTSDTGPARIEPDVRAARRAFLAAALRRPATMGAVAPSSPRLGAVLASVVPRSGSPVVVELGPGVAVLIVLYPRGRRPTLPGTPAHTGVPKPRQANPAEQVQAQTRPGVRA